MKARDNDPRAAPPTSVRPLEAPRSPADQPIRGKRRRLSLSSRRAGRGERSSRVIADDHPQVTASPASVRLLEAPAPADMPLTGSAADHTRRHDEPVGARSFRVAANDHPRATATPNSVCSRRQQRLTSRCLAAPPTSVVSMTCRSGRAVVPLQRERLPSSKCSAYGVRPLEAPASARKPMHGYAANLLRPLHVEIGARARSASPRTTTLVQLHRLPACACSRRQLRPTCR